MKIDSTSSSEEKVFKNGEGFRTESHKVIWSLNFQQNMIVTFSVQITRMAPLIFLLICITRQSNICDHIRLEEPSVLVMLLNSSFEIYLMKCCITVQYNVMVYIVYVL